MELMDLSMQVARLDERQQAMREEMHNSFHRVEDAFRHHVTVDEEAHARILELEHVIAKGKGAWKLAVGVATALGGAAGVVYYLSGIIHGG